ncbi:hypothetical protein D9619_009741 [Psilocybe cf. subviscida]|uniref:Uncharacterized protein n=1 Tax=Psilocybe cf. subviscida TaxID=2480587 RepID=A0A8H5F6H1_9AGAR|nr:hypothetical protein D9619_009741 [Psilocybe cf. subviscida]
MKAPCWHAQNLAASTRRRRVMTTKDEAESKDGETYAAGYLPASLSPPRPRSRFSASRFGDPSRLPAPTAPSASSTPRPTSFNLLHHVPTASITAAALSFEQYQCHSSKWLRRFIHSVKRCPCPPSLRVIDGPSPHSYIFVLGRRLRRILTMLGAGAPAGNNIPRRKAIIGPAAQTGRRVAIWSMGRIAAYSLEAVSIRVLCTNGLWHSMYARGSLNVIFGHYW